MDFEQIYKEESGFDVGKIHEIGIVYYSDDYVKWLEEKLLIHGVVASLPTYKETKIECKKQLKEMNESYALGTIRSYEKRFFTSGFIRCYLFMKGKR